MTFLFSKISKVKYLSLLTGILAFPIAANAQVCGVLKSEALGMGGAKYEYTIILQSPPAGMTGDFVQTVQFSMDSIKVETKGLVPKARQLKGNRIMDPRGKIILQGQIIYDKSKNIPTLSESVPSMGVVFPEVNAEPEFVTLMATKFRDSNLKVIKNAPQKTIMGATGKFSVQNGSIGIPLNRNGPLLNQHNAQPLDSDFSLYDIIDDTENQYMIGGGMGLAADAIIFTWTPESVWQSLNALRSDIKSITEQALRGQCKLM